VARLRVNTGTILEENLQVMIMKKDWMRSYMFHSPQEEVHHEPLSTPVIQLLLFLLTL
jgi:hypothetical protein